MKDSGEIYGVDLTDEGLKTPYTSKIFSGTWLVITSLIFGVVALVLMLAVTINPDIFGESDNKKVTPLFVSNLFGVFQL